MSAKRSSKYGAESHPITTAAAAAAAATTAGTTTTAATTTTTARNALTLTWSRAEMSAKRSSEYPDGIRCK